MASLIARPAKQGAAAASETRPELNGESLVKPLQAVDTERIRLTREAELQNEIAKCPDLQTWLEEAGPVVRERQWALRRHHLASSVRITPRISEKLSARFDCVRQILGSEIRAELYIEHSAEIGAACSAMPDGSLLVTMTSGAAEKLSASEQLFVLGHEVGHFILGHHDWPVSAILAPNEHSDSPLSPRLALQLLSWSRCCEVSADRFGLLCAQSEEAMARAFLKLASGLPSRLLGSGEDYLAQLDEWIAHRTDDEGWFATHPLHGIRIHAGQIFWRSAYVDEIFGPGEQSTEVANAEDADAAAAEQLAFMDPDPGKLEETDYGASVSEMLGYVGVMLIGIDGDFDPLEFRVLETIGDADHANRAIGILNSQGSEALADETTSRLRAFEQSTPDAAHFQVVVQLIALAHVDSHLDYREVNLIREVADILGYGEMVVDQMLEQLTSGEWSE